MALQAAFTRVLTSRAKGWLALATALISTACVAALWPTVFHGSPIDHVVGVWDGPVTWSYHVDGLSMLFALMGTAIGSAVLLFSIEYMAEDVSATRFYILMLLFIGGLVNLVFSANLLVLYASWELVGVCSYLLVGFWYTQREAADGARKVFVITHAAGYALLAAIIILFARTGTLTWTDPRIGAAFTGGIFALMFVAAMAKSVQYPLHTWIPSAMAAPSPVSALLHSACYVTVGVYLVARMHSFAVWPSAWSSTVVWVGTVTMLVGMIFALVQNDSKRMLAFSTVSHVGYMMLGLGLSTALGIIAGLLHTLNHGLFKGSLFLGAGAVQHATGTRDMNRLGGLARTMPSTTVIWGLATAAIVGVPLFNGFVSKWLIYIAALDAGYTIPALVAWVTSILTMFVMLKATSSMFFGDTGEACGSARESGKTMLVGSGVLAAGCVVLGVAPQLAIDYVVTPALASMGLHSGITVSWLGITSAGSRVYALGGLVLVLLSLLVGAVAWLETVRRRPSAVPSAEPSAARPVMLAAIGPAAAAFAPIEVQPPPAAPTFTGGEPLSAAARLRASDFSQLVASNLAPFLRWADPDRYLLGVWRATLATSGAAGHASRWLEERAVWALGAGAVVLGVAVAATVSPSRASAAPALATHSPVLLGAIGVALVALLLALGARAQSRRLVWIAAVCGAAVLGGLALEQPLIRLALLEAAAFGTVALLFASDAEPSARITYLAATVISAATLAAGTLLLPSGPANLALALLIAGFAIKFALVPLYMWLPRMARLTPAPLVGFVVAVIDAAAFGELFALRAEAPWLFSAAWPWVALGLLSALGGAGLMLAARDLKRMLAFFAAASGGFVVLGVALASDLGAPGAIALAAADVLVLALLFAAIAPAEMTRPVTLGTRGLAGDYPLSSAAFVLGSLTALGLPFTAGWPGHWRIYAAANADARWILAALVVATILILLAFTRAIALTWWGTPAESPEAAAAPADQVPAPDAARAGSAPDATTPGHSPRTTGDWVLGSALVLLMLAILVAGLFPQLLAVGQ